jgi:hypothetical protein
MVAVELLAFVRANLAAPPEQKFVPSRCTSWTNHPHRSTRRSQ